MNEFAFEAAEEIYSNSVVERIAFAGHTLENTKIIESLTIRQSGILDAAVRAEDKARFRLTALYGQIQCGESEISVNAVRERAAVDLLYAKVFANQMIQAVQP